MYLLCEKIDFDKYLGWPMIRRKKLGRPKDQDQDCPFCRLVMNCIIESEFEISENSEILLHNEPSWKLTVVHSPYNLSKRLGYSTYYDKQSMAKETNGKTAYSLLILLNDWTCLGHIQYVAEKEPRNKRHFYGRRVDPNHVNFDLIRSWLPTCEAAHERSCEQSGHAAKRRPTIRVVDTSQRRVITAPEGCNYVALSYCWGPEGKDCRHVKTMQKDILVDQYGDELPIALPGVLPQTIEDSILVTRELGFRYLWNAALCIVQDDKRDRHVQVLRMDGIYSSAVLTIAAATGSHANSGIAGISRPRTLRQKTENVNGLHLALAMPNHGSTQTDPHWYGTAGLGLFRKKSCPRDCFYSQIVRCISSAQTQSGAKTLSLRRTTARRAGARSGCRYDGQPTGRPENSVWRTTSP